MKLTPKTQKAIEKAAVLHYRQKRKAGSLPYIVHPYSVAFILANYTDDEDIIVAGILHDVLEDVKNYYYKDLKNDFGKKVARIVRELSEDKNPNIKIDEKATWEERKRKYLDNLGNASFEAMMVCAADKIHNLQSMREAYHKQGEKLWTKFNAPADKKLWFYEGVVKILLQKLDNSITKELTNELKETRNTLSVQF